MSDSLIIFLFPVSQLFTTPTYNHNITYFSSCFLKVNKCINYTSPNSISSSKYQSLIHHLFMVKYLEIVTSHSLHNSVIWFLLSPLHSNYPCQDNHDLVAKYDDQVNGHFSVSFNWPFTTFENSIPLVLVTFFSPDCF